MRACHHWKNNMDTRGAACLHVDAQSTAKKIRECIETTGMKRRVLAFSTIPAMDVNKDKDHIMPGVPSDLVKDHLLDKCTWSNRLTTGHGQAIKSFSTIK